MSLGFERLSGNCQVLSAMQRATHAHRTALSTHTTTWNTFCHNTALLITMHFYWLILQKCKFSQAQCKLPEMVRVDRNM